MEPACFGTAPALGIFNRAGSLNNILSDKIRMTIERVAFSHFSSLKRQGHPIGATGGRILANLLRELQRRDGRYGLETMCIGGGQGIAAIFERA